MKHVLLTGASGFVGEHVLQKLCAEGRYVRRAVRRATSLPRDAITIGDIGPATDWASALEGVEAVLHLAAHVHAPQAAESDFQRVNLEGTRRLAEEAARAGVKRFVFVSSIKVNGEATAENPFREDDAPRPLDAYGRSKRDAEKALWRVAADTGLEVVVVRPPLVHGPGAGGNLRRLMSLLARGVPLPLAAIDNRRSMIGVANLADLLALCLDHPSASGETFLAADTPALSTPELLRMIAAAMGREARLFPVPAPLLRLAARVLNRQDDLDRLCSSLEVDADKARARLGWAPSISIEQSVSGMARSYVDEARG